MISELAILGRKPVFLGRLRTSNVGRYGMNGKQRAKNVPRIERNEYYSKECAYEERSIEESVKNSY